MKKGDDKKSDDKKSKDEACCPKFKPKLWENKTVVWKKKAFVKAKYLSVFHKPLNIGSVIKKSIKKIDDAKDEAKNFVMLADEKSPFYSNIYFSVKKPIEGAHDVRISGTFLTKVFEGPYSNMKNWKKEMKEYVESKKKEVKSMLFYYPTCPGCAEKDGKNYVVIFAEI